MNTNTSLVCEKAKKAINEYNMLKKGSTVIVGLSGGADSVCLLHFLNSVKDEYNLRLVVAHINHGIRGDEAISDSIFSQHLAEEMKLPFSLLNADCVKEAKENNETLEEAGRRIRYTFFNSLIEDENTVIATAHNSNDNMETVIFNLTRGASLSGASGIPPKRDNIIRPLIFVTRAEIEGYCTENNLSFVTDSTNLKEDYTRNKIRIKVIPELLKINESAASAFSRFSYLARQDEDFIRSQVEEAYLDIQIGENKFSTKKLMSLHEAIRGRVLIMAVKQFCGESLDSKKLEAIISSVNANTKIQLYKNCYCQTKNGELLFFCDDFEKKSLPETKMLTADFNGGFGDYTVKCQKYENNSKKVKKFLLDNLIDCDTISGNLVLRSRCEGDKITLRKRRVTKTLKKLFIEEGIPEGERAFIPVIADDNGVVWVSGFGVNLKNAPTEDSKNIILVEACEYGNK